MVVTAITVAAGLLFGDQYNVLDRVNLPRIPLPTDTAARGSIITGLVLLAVTLLAAIVGGKAGHRYHDKVDRVALR